MGCSRFLITNATSREWFFFSVPQMLSLNTTYDCCAHFLCREILLFITHCTKAFSNQKTRGGISLPCCLQRTFLLTHYHLKQTICLLSISPCRFLHLHFPCLLPSLSTPSCCIVIVASPAQAHQGPKHPHAASPPRRHRQTSVLACCPSQGHPCRRWSFYAYLSWFQKPPKIAVEWQNSAKSSILSFRLQTADH